MPAAVPTLRIAVLGAGRIGSAFAFQLARLGGHDVTVVARPGSERLRQLGRDGAIVDAKGARAAVRVLDALDEATAYDLVLVTMPAHLAEAVLPALGRSAAAQVLCMFNTLDPERLVAAVGAGRCGLGMPFVQASLSEDGRLAAVIGAGGQKTIMDRPEWVAVFRAAGMPAALEPEMALWLRSHVPLCVAFESVSVAGMRRGGGASWREALVLARGVHAGFALVRRLGFAVYPRSKRRIAASPARAVAAVLWSVSRLRPFRELLATGEAECRALVDAMVARAPQAGPGVDVAAIEAMRPAGAARPS